MREVFKAMAGESIVELTALTADSYLNYLHKCPWEHTKKKINLIMNAHEKTSFAQWQCNVTYALPIKQIIKACAFSVIAPIKRI